MAGRSASGSRSLDGERGLFALFEQTKRDYFRHPGLERFDVLEAVEGRLAPVDGNDGLGLDDASFTLFQRDDLDSGIDDRLEFLELLDHGRIVRDPMDGKED